MERTREQSDNTSTPRESQSSKRGEAPAVRHAEKLRTASAFFSVAADLAASRLLRAAYDSPREGCTPFSSVKPLMAQLVRGLDGLFVLPLLAPGLDEFTLPVNPEEDKGQGF